MTKDMITGLASVPEMVNAALERNTAAQRAANASKHTSELAFAISAHNRAVIYEREARWWGVLRRWLRSAEAEVAFEFSGPTLRVLDIAVSAAEVDAYETAERLREVAASTRARMARRASTEGAA
jgi:hypothetical protein